MRASKQRHIEGQDVSKEVVELFPQSIRLLRGEMIAIARANQP